MGEGDHRGRGEEGRAGEGREREAVTQEPRKNRDPREPRQKPRGLRAEASFSRAPPLRCPPGAPPCPARPEAQRAPGQVRASTAQWCAPGPPPRSRIGRFRAGLALLTSSLGSGGPTRSRLVRPGTRPARRRQRRARPRAPELAAWRGAGGTRGTARGARAPGAPRGRPRSQPAQSPCLAAHPRCGWRWGPALHGPGC